jgi:hypothetical protein
MLLPVNAASAARALNVLRREVAANQHSRGALEAFAAPGADLPVPSYHLFSSTPSGRAAEWLAPHLTRDFEDCLAVYEDLADRKLGVTPRPDRPVGVLLGRKHGRLLPMYSRDRWWEPAAVLLGVLSNVLDVPVEGYPGSNLRLQHEGYQFDLTPTSMWSNFRAQRNVCVEPSSHVFPDSFRVRAKVADHPLVRVAYLPGMSDAALWAASYLIDCEERLHQRVKPEQLLQKPGAARSPRRGPLNRRYAGADRAAAVAGCRELLQHGGTLRDLYQTAVPYLMTSTDFKRNFSCPWTHPELRLTSAKVETLNDLLEEAERAL